MTEGTLLSVEKPRLYENSSVCCGL